MEKVRLIRIGRALDNDVVINDLSISPYHLELFQDHLGKVFLSDLNSESGTFINGEKLVSFTYISFSDKVTLAGKFIFDWLKLTNFKDISQKIEINTSNWIFSENKMNAVHLPTIEDLDQIDYKLNSNASFNEKLKYFYTNNASIVHIFMLNIVLFILFYLAFLS